MGIVILTAHGCGRHGVGGKGRALVQPWGGG